MSAVRSRSHHRSRSSPSRRYYAEDEGLLTIVHQRENRDERLTRPSHKISPRRSARSSTQRRVYKDEGGLDGGIPPLRRESTQPPRRHSSPTASQRVGTGTPQSARRDRNVLYHRRDVEPTSQRSSRSRRQRSSRYSTPIPDSSTSSALVVVDSRDERRLSPRRHQSPRRSGRVASPKQHHTFLQNGSSTVVTPPRSHRLVSSPDRHRRGESRRESHRTASARRESPQRHSSSRRRRLAEEEMEKPVSRERAASSRRHERRRHQSPSVEDRVKVRRSSNEVVDDREPAHMTPRRSHRHHNIVKDEERESPRRHRSSTRRTNSGKPSSSGRVSSHHDRVPSYDSAKAAPIVQGPAPPPEEPHPKTPVNPTHPVHLGSTYLRPQSSHRHAGDPSVFKDPNRRPRSGSYHSIEILSISSGRPGGSHPGNFAPMPKVNSPTRRREIIPPAIVPHPNAELLTQRIDSTRNWIQQMKEEVQHDARVEKVQRERQSSRSTRRRRTLSPTEVRCQKDENSAFYAAPRPSTAERLQPGVNKPSTSVKPTHRRELSGSDMSSRDSSRQVAAPTRHHKVRSSSTASGTNIRSVPPSQLDRETPTLNSHVTSKTSARVEEELRQPIAAETLDSSRQGSFDGPVYSFVSFLDGNTFHSTASLCQYNVAVAEGLSDAHLDVIRAAVFQQDEVVFAELLYGDDIQAELNVIEATLGHSTDRAIEREKVILQRAAVNRFNSKCNTALSYLLAAGEGVAEAVRVAASQLDTEGLHGDATPLSAPY